jgi:hypothetical protein
MCTLDIHNFNPFFILSIPYMFFKWSHFGIKSFSFLSILVQTLHFTTNKLLVVSKTTLAHDIFID